VLLFISLVICVVFMMGSLLLISHHKHNTEN
jgi:hypothetical protein